MGIDHSHKNEKIRGILCNWCNTALGNFHDNIELLKKAILYLEVDGNDIEIGERTDTSKYAISTRGMRYLTGRKD